MPRPLKRTGAEEAVGAMIAAFVHLGVDPDEVREALISFADILRNDEEWELFLRAMGSMAPRAYAIADDALQQAKRSSEEDPS